MVLVLSKLADSVWVLSRLSVLVSLGVSDLGKEADNESNSVKVGPALCVGGRVCVDDVGIESEVVRLRVVVNW